MKNVVLTPRNVLTAAAALVGLAAVANADFSDIIFRIEATNANGSGSFVGHLGDGRFYEDGSYDWRSGHIDITDDTGNIIASLDNAYLFLRDDPEVTLNFQVTAGALDTAFTITSATVSFLPIQGEGRAAAGISITDVNGGGATLTGTHNNGAAYLAQYNGAVPNGTNFASLLSDPVVAGEFDSADDNEEFPGGGLYTPIAGLVDDMSARWKFSVSRGDAASGTSTYIINIIPSPSSLALLGLGGLLAARRRR